MFRPKNTGFTIIEAMVAVAVFCVLVLGILGSYGLLSRTMKTMQVKVAASTLAANYMEAVKNLPYAQVGTVSGNPSGNLADVDHPIVTSIFGQSHKIYYEVTYIDDPADGTAILGNDFTPNDYKQVKLTVENIFSGAKTDFLTNLAQRSLEGDTNSGSLLIRVLDIAGNPVSDANIVIKSPTTSPTMILSRVSATNGTWLEVGLPAAVNGYRVEVSKSGYTSASTTYLSQTNLNPTNPDPTILDGQLTSVTFVIDRVADLIVRTVDTSCAAIPNVNLNIKGTSLLSANPDIYKFDQNFSTGVTGILYINGLAPDTYTPSLISGQTWVVLGTSPVQKIDVMPGNSQVFTMILGQNSTANSLLVIVKDSTSGATLEGVDVHLQKGGSVVQDFYATTGGSVWQQLSWTGGGGQEGFSDKEKYFSDDGNIDINSSPTGVRLKKVSGKYASSGILESSYFDTGTSQTDFTTLEWEPPTQDNQTTLKFQVATNDDHQVWNYVGPDGSTTTYFTTTGNSLASSLNHKRYVRYKAYLSTTNDRKTPVLTGLKINYVSGCYTPGQVFFGDLTSGQNYSVEFFKSGYENKFISSLNIVGNQILEVQLDPI